MKKGLLSAFIVFYCVLFWGCWGFGTRPPRPEPFPVEKAWGYKPVFTTDSSFFIIRTEAPRSIKNPGKIYVKGDLIFQSDEGFGVHIIDKTDPSSPERIGFIKINGNTDMSISGNYMYANSYTDLVVLDITDWHNVQVLKRIQNAFIQGVTAGGNQHYFIPPPEKGVYFDCSYYNYQPGTVQSGWVRDSVYKWCFYQ